MSGPYFIGVDVGTGSARAALVTAFGKVICVDVQPIKTWNPLDDHYEQSSDDIWNACVHAIKVVTTGKSANDIKGLGFDATCSLVALGKNGKPITVSTTGKNEQNVILWMDHRASKEAAEINRTGHSILQNVGGKISLEMETPKLKWLKKNIPETWKNAGLFFDLPDFLTWKATGSETRSLCSLVCKWCYEAKPDGPNGWSKSCMTAFGLEDLLENNSKIIGNTVLAPGEPCGSGLTPEVAAQLHLNPGTPVGTSIIDAHAGALGMLGCTAGELSHNITTKLGMISGTSTCHMLVQDKMRFVKGVWGPYYSALVPGKWLHEAGQSATGALLDHVIRTHPAYNGIRDKIGKDKHIVDYLNELLTVIAQKRGVGPVALLTKNVHVWPDYHGNRSPIADPTLKGMISGLSLSVDEESLAILYLSVVQALCYGTRHIIEALQDASADVFVESVLMCGGLSRNKLFVQTQADVRGTPVLIPDEMESVLIGAAALGACSARKYSSLEEAIKAMGGSASVVIPDREVAGYHDLKYKVFLRMLQHQREYDSIMNPK